MQAQLLGFPLLMKEAEEREIEAVNNEFEGQFSDDNVRMELILNQSITDRSHPLAIFGWGNMESLAGRDKETLCDDVRKYYEDHYSSDRLNLVIQT